MQHPKSYFHPLSLRIAGQRWLIVTVTLWSTKAHAVAVAQIVRMTRFCSYPFYTTSTKADKLARPSLCVHQLTQHELSKTTALTTHTHTHTAHDHLSAALAAKLSVPCGDCVVFKQCSTWAFVCSGCSVGAESCTKSTSTSFFCRTRHGCDRGRATSLCCRVCLCT